MLVLKMNFVRALMVMLMAALGCSLQPSPLGCLTKKLSEARGNGIGFLTAGEAAPFLMDAVRLSSRFVGLLVPPSIK